MKLPSTTFHKVPMFYSLDGENIDGGTPLVAWVDLLSITAADKMEG